jgi:Leucine-rich repeat (LRR) protein
MSASKMSASKAPWYVPTPAKGLVVLLIVQAILFVSHHYQWFEFNRPKGNTLLIACAATLLGLLVGMAWMLVRLFWSRAQFNLATLFLIVPVIAIPCAWFARDYQQAEEQRLLIKSLQVFSGDRFLRNELQLDKGKSPSSLRSRARHLLEPVVGIDFFADVTDVEIERDIMQGEIADIARFPKLERLTIFGEGIAKAGLAPLKNTTNLEFLFLIDHSGGNPKPPRFSDDDTQTLAALSQLEVLHLSGSQVTDEGLKHLSRLSNLRALHFGPEEVTDQGLRHLGNLPRLTSLDLAESKVTDAGLASLANLTNLYKLELRNTSVTDTGLAHLRKLTSLQDLDLRNTRVTDEGLAELAELTELTSLDLSGTKVATLEHLQGLSQLAVLELSGTRVANLEDVSKLNQLHELNLLSTEIADDELAYLRELKELRILSLSETEITDAGLVHLSGLENLEELTLKGTKVTSAGMEHLAGLPRLEHLNLDGSEVGDEGLVFLQNLPRLRHLYVSDSRVTKQGQAEFTKAKPKCTVQNFFATMEIEWNR